MEYRIYNPKSVLPRSYDDAFIEAYETRKTEIEHHIPRELAHLKAKQALRGASLLREEVQAVRVHALSLDPIVVSELDEMIKETKQAEESGTSGAGDVLTATTPTFVSRSKT